MACCNGEYHNEAVCPCKEIVDVIYPEKRGEIMSAIGSVMTDLSDIGSELGKLTVPNDYLGQKVVERLGKISESFGQNANSSVESLKGTIESYIEGKIEMHKGHCASWQKAKDLYEANLNSDDVEE